MRLLPILRASIIKNLHDRGVLQDYKVALLSNVIKDALPRDRLAPYFDAMVISGEVGVAKPDPSIYLLAAGQLDVAAAECIMVDDSSVYCQGAESVGMKAVVYTDLPRLRSVLRDSCYTK